MRRVVLAGDCLAVMSEMDAASVDAIVTDPPYGLKFMGKAWDHGVPGVEFWTQALRVAKPGAHLVAFGGTRTFHRLACAIEDAGWEIRDTLGWLYGSGFPKSLDVSKAIDKAAGHWRGRAGAVVSENGSMSAPNYERTERGEPVTAAAAWSGWGTALKPAWEPIILARKPLIGTVAANVMTHGTGALNVDACRVKYVNEEPPDTEHWKKTSGGWKNTSSAGVVPNDNSKGRWPANIVTDGSDEVLAVFPDTGPSGVRRPTGKDDRGVPGFVMRREDTAERGISDSGGSAARFFYTAKASTSERNDGIQDGRNHHPTVKPLALMRWLVRLVTPPDGIVLDPFCGSGTTLLAAKLEGFSATGIEMDPEYVAIAEARVASVQGTLEEAR